VAVSAVVDTNVWVSAFLTPHGFPARLITAGRTGRFTVVSSLPLLEELLEVLHRPRIMKVRQTTTADAEAYVQGVAAVAQLVTVLGNLHLCRDSDDDWVLETALAGGATHVVSRDEDVTRDPELQEQLKLRGITALTVSQLLTMLDKERPQ
jgi:uncharacterized protein